MIDGNGRTKRLMAGGVLGLSALAFAPGSAGAAISTADFCANVPEGESGFTDIAAAGVHEDNVECLVAAEITSGVTPTTYAPTAPVTRGQMATFIANMIDAANELDLPGAPDIADLPSAAAANDAFTDDENSVHETNINRLAQAGVVEGTSANTYDPLAPVSRAQMATFLAEAIEFITGSELSPGTVADAFTDDEGIVHESNINALAAADIVDGVGNNMFNPSGIVSRAQMASFIIQAMAYLEAEGVIAPLPAGAVGDFAVQPVEAAAVIVGGEREYTAQVPAGVSTVDILLVACANVTVEDDGDIVFADANNDNIADQGTIPAGTGITEVNGIVRPSTAFVDDAAAANGTVAFTVDTVSEGCVRPVVFVDADNDDMIDLDANNMPTEVIGLGGALTAINPADIDADPETDINPFGTQHTVTAQVVNGAAPPQPVGLAGQTIRFQITRGIADAACDEGTDLGGTVGAGGTVVALGSGTTNASGQATFTYTGPADPTAAPGDTIFDCVLAFHDADNDSVVDAGEFQDVVQKQWTDAAPAVSALVLTPELDTNLVGTAHTVTGTVLDQFGNPVDTAVRFEVYRDGGAVPVVAATRATGADGVAEFAYAGPATQADDDILACVEAPGGGGVAGECDLGDTVIDVAQKFWVTTATDASGDVAAADVIGFDTTADTVDVETAGGDNIRIPYDGTDQYNVDGSAVTMAQFEAALSVGDTLSVTYNPNGVSIFTLTNV